MSTEPIAAFHAVTQSRHLALSARPDAPVVPEPAPRRSGPSRVRAVRAGLAAELRTVARWVEPAPRPAEACQAG